MPKHEKFPEPMRPEDIALSEEGFRFNGVHLFHELKTPLAEIISLAELAEATEEADKRKWYLGLLRNSSMNLLDLVSHLLNVSPAGYEQTGPNLVPVDVEHYLSGLLDPLRVIAELKDLRLRWGTASSVPRLLPLDPVKTAQILRNLVANSIKYTIRGEIVVSASLEKRNKAETIVFMVRDTGVGFDQELQKDLFLPYKKLPWPGERDFAPEGTGLGLFLVKHLLEELQASLSVESSPGVGSCFRLVIPLEDRSPKEEQPAEREYRSRAGLGTKAAKILLVEDNEVSLAYLSYFLELRGGYSVKAVRNGSEAVEALRNHYFNLVLMDLHMPIMDGLTALTSIREGAVSPSVRNIPVIALTAYLAAAEREALVDSGFDGLAIKPVSIEQLIGQIERVLGKPADGAAADSGDGRDDGGDGPSFDDDAFSEKYRGSDEIGAQVLSIFISEGPERIAAMKKASIDEDMEGMKRFAHSLANSCGTVCAVRGLRLARKLEEACCGKRTEEVKHLLREFAIELDEAVERAKLFRKRRYAGFSG